MIPVLVEHQRIAVQKMGREHQVPEGYCCYGPDGALQKP